MLILWAPGAHIVSISVHIMGTSAHIVSTQQGYRLAVPGSNSTVSAELHLNFFRGICLSCFPEIRPDKKVRQFLLSAGIIPLRIQLHASVYSVLPSMAGGLRMSFTHHYTRSQRVQRACQIATAQQAHRSDRSAGNQTDRQSECLFRPFEDTSRFL